MPPPRVYKTPAIVLRQRRLGERDKIITLYSAEHGKIEAVAKSVRRMQSRLAGHVEPLNHGNFMLAHGRNLDVITQVQTIETFQSLREDLGRLSHALYACELVDRATEEREENFALYRALLDTLRRLSEDHDLDLVLRFFEMALLVLLGYGPQTERCASCGGDVPLEGSVWAPALGGALCAKQSCRPEDVQVRALSPNALKALRLLATGSFSQIEGLGINGELADELERDLRSAIHYALDRDVRSAKFLDTVRGRSTGNGRTFSNPGPRRPARL
jgi:DNA repair protein RecO (recombination protein O)